MFFFCWKLEITILLHSLLFADLIAYKIFLALKKCLYKGWKMGFFVVNNRKKEINNSRHFVCIRKETATEIASGQKDMRNPVAA